MRSKRAIISMMIAAFLVSVLVLSVVEVLKMRASVFPATAEPMEQLQLNFPYQGTVSSVSVASGQRVSRGSVLATETVGPIIQKVEADQAVVAANEANLESLLDPSLSGTQATTLNQKVSQAQNSVQISQNSLASTKALGSQLITQTQNYVNTSQNTLNSDQALFASACPHGVQAPPSQSSMSTYCLSLSNTIAQDQKSLSAARAQLSAVNAQVASSEIKANSSLSSAASSLTAAQNSLSNASQGGSNAQVAMAKAQLATNEAQLASDQSILSSLTLKAPADGVVVAMNGNVGAVTGSDGVTQYLYNSAAPGVSSTSLSGTSFVGINSGPASGPTSLKSAFAVLDVVKSWFVYVYVPQSQLSSVRKGVEMQVSFTGVKGNYLGKIGGYLPTATQVNGATYYQVRVNMHGEMPVAVLPGMTGSASVA